MKRAELRMLAAKAWRESRLRFALGAAVLAAVCAALVVFHAELRRAMGAPVAYDTYVYLRIYESVGRAVFWLLAIVLGLGGLWRERAHGTIGFTLALPVPRAAHAIVRAAVGLAEVAALAMVPAILVPLASRAVGEAYPWSQALGFALLWIAAGSAIFAFSFLSSIVFRGDYVALALAVLLLRLGSAALPKLPGLAAADLHHVMTGRGMAYFDAAHARLIEPPWLAAALTLGVALGLLGIALGLSRRQRYHEP